MHCVTGKAVALKQVYLKQPVRRPAGLSNPALNVLREIAALRALKHPNVVTLLDVVPRVYIITSLAIAMMGPMY